ncbi:peptide deformylase [candidate division WOR-3 bacterium]|nr:peptide deformylase [candidate division WOR-3 bacterium]
MKILHYPDPILKTVTADVVDFDQDLKDLIQKMIPVMKELDGVGLAANQVGILRNFFIVQIPQKKLVVAVNPKIISFSEDKITSEEGCLSLPGLYLDIPRSKKVILEAFDEQGRKFTMEATGLLSRAFCHETDHLKGKLIIDFLDLEDRISFEAHLNTRKLF